MTRPDLLEHNVDLIACAAQILRGKLSFPLELAAAGTPPITKLRITAKNIDRLDLSIEDRPLISSDVSDGSTDIPLPRALTAGARIVARGYRQGHLVSSARLRL